MRYRHRCWWGLGLLALWPAVAPAQTDTAYFNFRGKHLLVLSDADMLASGYITGDAGPRTPDLQDQLTVLPLTPSELPRPVAALPVSNSVKAWPSNLATTPDGRYALVTELYAPPPAGATAMSATPEGRALTVVDLQASGGPAVVSRTEVARRLGPIAVRPQGDVVAVASGEKSRELLLMPLRNGQLGKPVSVQMPKDLTADIAHLAWHPSGNFLALSSRADDLVRFFRYQPGTNRLEPWGNTVMPGKRPGVGYFTPDGQHYLVTNLFWGSDVAGQFVGSQQGMLTAIRFAAAGTTPQHLIVSTAGVGGSPENFAISPDGRWAVSLDMEQSYLPVGAPGATPYSALTLLALDPATGRLTPQHRALFEGILPEGITFDASGRYLAVAVFDHHNPQRPGGTVDFWRLVLGPAPKLVKLDFAVPVMRGAHIVKLVQ